MSVVIAAQFKLARARKALEQTLANKDWNALRRCDLELSECLGVVFDDESRDTHVLLNELEMILGLYAKIISELPEEAISRRSLPAKES